MIAIFTFSLSQVALHIRRQNTWTMMCKAEFENTSPDSYPLRGDVSFLGRFQTELTLSSFDPYDADRTFYANGLNARIQTWITEGYPAPEDAFGLRYWPKTDEKNSDFLGAHCSLGKEKYLPVDNFLSRHIGSQNLIGRIICPFHGFSEPDYPLRDIPSMQEFREGQHYFVTGQSSITFSARDLP